MASVFYVFGNRSVFSEAPSHSLSNFVDTIISGRVNRVRSSQGTCSKQMGLNHRLFRTSGTDTFSQDNTLQRLRPSLVSTWKTIGESQSVA